MGPLGNMSSKGGGSLLTVPIFEDTRENGGLEGDYIGNINKKNNGEIN